MGGVIDSLKVKICDIGNSEQATFVAFMGRVQKESYFFLFAKNSNWKQQKLPSLNQHVVSMTISITNVLVFFADCFF